MTKEENAHKKNERNVGDTKKRRKKMFDGHEKKIGCVDEREGESGNEKIEMH